MGCASSKPDEEHDVVSFCRERKRFMKLAVQRRFALADAYCKYNHSLYSVAAAIRLFIVMHASPSTSFLITFPSPTDPTETLISNPLFLQQTQSEATHESMAYKLTDSTVHLDSSSKVDKEKDEEEEEYMEEEEEDGVDEYEEEEEEEEVFEDFNGGVIPPMLSSQRDCGWDFFNPFDGVKTEVVNGFSQSSADDFKVIREEEGIPELEEDGESERGGRKSVMVNNGDVGHESSAVFEAVKVDAANVNQGEHQSMRVIDTPSNGRELLEALKDVVDHFIRAYDSGMDVSKMLEANSIQIQSGLEETKEGSIKLTPLIAWCLSTSSQSSSCTSFLASSSKSSSTWTEFKNDLFEDYGGMNSGSHSLTLGRLYAWEKKLYEEVKAGHKTRKNYERKCLQLRNQDARGDDFCSVDKTKAEVKDLYTRILVGIQSVESISKRIWKLRDEELLPQLVELLHGLVRTWKIMLESHENQNKTMFEVKSFSCTTYGRFCNDSHRLATLQLEAELQNWRACFSGYVSAQKAYVEALDGWLSKFIAPEVEFYSRGRSLLPPSRIRGPTLLVMCRNWLASLEKLPDKAVKCAMKSFAKDTRALWVQQGEEQQQKKKVDGLAKLLDRRVHAFQKAESRILESKLSEQKSEVDVKHRIEYLTERKDLLDTLRKKLDAEKAKHHSNMQETQRVTLNGLQMGFSSVFESLIEFSKASLEIYSDLVTYGEDTKLGDEKGSNPPFIDGNGLSTESG